MCYANNLNQPLRQPVSAGAYAQDFREIVDNYHPSMGARVPPDSMRDTPFFIRDPIDTGGETSLKPPSNQRQEEEENLSSRQPLIDEMARLSKLQYQRDLTPEEKARFDAIYAQENQLYNRFRQLPSGSIGDRRDVIRQQVPETADVLMRAVEERQRQGRRPVPPQTVPEGFLGS